MTDKGEDNQNSKKFAELVYCFETHSIKYLFSLQWIVALQNYDIISHSNRFKGFKSCNCPFLPLVAILSMELPFKKVHLKEIDVQS